MNAPLPLLVRTANPANFGSKFRPELIQLQLGFFHDFHVRVCVISRHTMENLPALNAGIDQLAHILKLFVFAQGDSYFVFGSFQKPVYSKWGRLNSHGMVEQYQ
jgi:hypothetical protein